MKKLLILVIITAFTISVWAQSKKSIGKVSFPIGKNFIQSKGSVDWNKVRYFMPVYDMDKVKTEEDARCEVTFTNKKVMRIGANSVAEITRDDSGVEEVKMSKGLAYMFSMMAEPNSEHFSSVGSSISLAKS